MNGQTIILQTRLVKRSGNRKAYRVGLVINFMFNLQISIIKKTETSIFENLNATEMEAVKAGKSEVMSESMEAEAMGDGALLFCCDTHIEIEDRH